MHYHINRNIHALSVFLARVTLVLALTLTAPVTTYASEDGLPPHMSDHVLALAYTHQVDAREIQPVLDALSQAARRNYPLEPLVQKVEEGLGKRVPPARIVAALQTMTARFERFDAILDRLSPDAARHRERLMERMNELAAMGMDPEELAPRLSAEGAPPAEQILNALEAKAALRNAGLSPEGIEQLLNAGLAAGYFQQSGLGLARMARAARDKGVPPEHIDRVAMQVVAGQTSMRDAAQKLGLGDAQANSGQGKNSAQGGARGADSNSGSGNGGGSGGGSGGNGGNGGNGGGGGRK